MCWNRVPLFAYDVCMASMVLHTARFLCIIMCCIISRLFNESQTRTVRTGVWFCAQQGSYAYATHGHVKTFLAAGWKLVWSLEVEKQLGNGSSLNSWKSQWDDSWRKIMNSTSVWLSLKRRLKMCCWCTRVVSIQAPYQNLWNITQNATFCKAPIGGNWYFAKCDLTEP